MTDSQRMEEEAARWLARMDAADLPETEHPVAGFEAVSPDFAAWVGTSAEHRVTFLRLYATWRRADRAAALAAPQVETVEIRALPVKKHAGWVAGLAAAVALIFLAGTALLDRSEAPQIFETAVGGHETVPLADGSRLELNTDTRLTAVITEAERLVDLQKGEAYFDIAHDDTRPFVVKAGDRRVTVLGTKFTVRRAAGEVEVVVAEGRVRIDDATSTDDTLPTIVEKDTVVVARAENTLVAERTPDQITAELGWRRGLLIFDQMELDEVAAEFNRYNRIKLVVDDPNAAAIRIGGSFRADNLDEFARLLEVGFGLKVQRDGNKIDIKS